MQRGSGITEKVRLSARTTNLVLEDDLSTVLPPQTETDFEALLLNGPFKIFYTVQYTFCKP